MRVVCVCLAVIEWIYYQWNNLNIQQVDPNDYGFYGQELELGPLRLIAHHGLRPDLFFILNDQPGPLMLCPPL